MLELLHIENIAIIEAADIEFAPGFNALTGETGAGKSIVIDSLSAVLGQRTSRELIRTGAEKAFVSAAFSGMAPELTEELGIQPEADGTLLLQREIQTDGKNVCRVNGRPVTSTGSTTGSSCWTRSSTLCIWTALAGWKVLQLHMLRSIKTLQIYGGRSGRCRWMRRKRPGG